jgi:hypothetical protein
MARFRIEKGGNVKEIVSNQVMRTQRNHWNKLHRYRLEQWDVEVVKKFYAQWKSNIPNYGCSCSSDWAAIEKKHPPVFDTYDKFFYWGVDRHNDVNKKLNKLQMDHASAYEMHRNLPVWTPPVEPIIYPLSNKLVITIATGTLYKQILDISRPTIKSYASKIGADYIELTNNTQRWPLLEKFRIGHYAKQYDRTLFLDADCLVKPNTPNLFNIVPEENMGFVNDYNCNPYGKVDKWLSETRKPLLNSQGVFLTEYNEPVVYNTGVIVCSRHHDVWNGMTKPFPMDHCDEQFWIEYQALRYPIYNLRQEFNNQYWYQNYKQRSKDSYIIHFSGAPNNKRIQLMKEEISQWSV